MRVQPSPGESIDYRGSRLCNLLFSIINNVPVRPGIARIPAFLTNLGGTRKGSRTPAPPGRARPQRSTSFPARPSGRKAAVRQPTCRRRGKHVADQKVSRPARGDITAADSPKASLHGHHNTLFVDGSHRLLPFNDAQPYGSSALADIFLSFEFHDPAAVDLSNEHLHAAFRQLCICRAVQCQGKNFSLQEHFCLFQRC